MILGISGRKQAGKNTTANILHGIVLKEQGFINDWNIDALGHLNILNEDGWGYFDVTRKDEQFVIQFICKMIHDNKTYSEIAEKLNEINIDKRGYTWTNNSVASVVKSNIKKTFVGFSKTLGKSLDEAIIDDETDVDSVAPPAKKKKKYNFRK